MPALGEAVLVTDRSALAPTAIVAVATLFVVLLSGVVVVTAAVAVTTPLAGTVKVMVREVLAFGAKLPIVYVALTKEPSTPTITIVPVTSAAVEVPKLANVTVAVTMTPAVALAGKATVVLTSASGAIVAVTVEMLLVAVGSGVVLVTLAKLVTATLWLVALDRLTITVMVAWPTPMLAAVAVKPKVLVTSVKLPAAFTLALTKLTPAGSTSVTVTLAAALGPALPTTIT